MLQSPHFLDTSIHRMMLLAAQAAGNTAPKGFSFTPKRSLQILANSGLQRLHSGLGLKKDKKKLSLYTTFEAYRKGIEQVLSAHPSFKMASHIQVTVDAFLDNKLQDHSEMEVQEGKRQTDVTLLILSARVSEKLPLNGKKDHDHICFFRT